MQEQAIQTLGKEKATLLKFLNNLTDTINNTDPDVNDSHTNLASDDSWERIVIAATVVLGILLRVDDSSLRLVVKKYFAELFCTLLIRLGTCSNAQTKGATMLTLHQLLLASHNQSMALSVERLPAYSHYKGSVPNDFHDAEAMDVDVIDDGPDLPGSDTSVVVGDLMTLFCRHHADKREAVFHFTQPFLQRDDVGHRSAATSFIANLIHSGLLEGKPLALEMVARNVDSLLSVARDDSPFVRYYAAKGLQHVLLLWRENLHVELMESAIKAAYQDRVRVPEDDNNSITELPFFSLCVSELLHLAQDTSSEVSLISLTALCLTGSDDKMPGASERDPRRLRTIGRLSDPSLFDKCDDDVPDLRRATLDLLKVVCEIVNSTSKSEIVDASPSRSSSPTSRATMTQVPPTTGEVSQLTMTRGRYLQPMLGGILLRAQTERTPPFLASWIIK